MRVFVTGGTGFIGSHLVRRLLLGGHEVAVLVRSPARTQRLDDVVEQVRVIPGDLQRIRQVEPAVAQWRPAACVHLAWFTEPVRYWDGPENLDALAGSLELLRMVSRIGCPRLVIAGTCAESDLESPDGPAAGGQPRSLYAASKLALNLVARQLAAQGRFSLAWARLFYLYGPHEDSRRLVPALVQALLRGEPFPATAGDQVRDYLHVEDVAAALAALAQQRATGIFDVCSGSAVTVRQLMEAVGDLIGRRELIQFGALPGGRPRYVGGDNRRLSTELRWSPRYPIGEGLRQTIAWWTAQVALARRAA